MNQAQKQGNNKGNQAVAQAFKLVRGQIVTLGNKIKNAADADKPALELEMKELMESIGMVYTGVQAPAAAEGEAPVEASVGGHILINLKATQEGIEATVSTDEAPDNATAAAAQPKLSLWQRFKGFIGRNKVTLLVSAAAALALGAGAYYLSQGRTTVISTFKGGIEATVEAPDVGTEAGSIFSTIGAFFVRIGTALKGYAVAAWNWIAGLFQKRSTVDVTVETPAPAPAADATVAAA